MWWPFQWLVIYVLGGLTLIPLLLVLGIGYVYKYGSVPIGDADPSKRLKAEIQTRSEREEILEKDTTKAVPLVKPLSGWLTVRRQFAPYVTSSSIFLPSTTTPETASAEAEENLQERDDVSIRSSTSTPNPASTGSQTPTPSAGGTNGPPTTYSARIASTYRQMMETRQKKESPPKEFLFCVLKGQVLFLYEDEAQSECVAAIGVGKYVVGIEGKEGGKFVGKDAEMFAKRNAIVLRMEDKEQANGKEGMPNLAKGMEGKEEDESQEVESAPWFLFCKSNTKMEDWYLALTQASALRPDIDGIFSKSDMQALVDTIDTEPDPIPLRWLNAMIGRLFFGVYRTQALEQAIIGKIMKKLSKVPRPSFLGPIIIREVNVGTFPPIFSKPMLKDLTAEGTASFEVHLNYRCRPSQPNSEVRITIATTATIPTGFKPYVVDLVLAVIVKSFEGNMVVQIKKPPSNRLWYGFTTMPKMEIEIQPVVSERKIQIGMVLKAIEKQLRDVIAESVVAPNMDDIAFFDTSDLDVRGGIFSSAGKVVHSLGTAVPAAGSDAATQPNVGISQSAEDPSSAVPETSGLRKRQPSKAHTLNTNRPLAAAPADKEGDARLPRTDTAPANLASVANLNKSATIQATKKWFSTNGRPPSISSLAGISKENTSKESLLQPKAKSLETASVREGPSRADPAAGDERSAVPTPVFDEPTGAVSCESVLGNGIEKAASISSSRTSNDTARPASTPNPTTDDAGTSAAQQGPASTASLITSLRARDKKAIQSQVTSARDAVKKWGVNWAAKRKPNIGGLGDDAEEDRSAAVYRPPDEDIDVNAGYTGGLSRSSEGHKTLQERLSAAAAQANRPKSGSVSSPSPGTSAAAARPVLQPSPSKPSASVSSLGTSPPQWSLSAPAPTTGLAKDGANARHSGSTPPGSHSSTKTDGNGLARQASPRQHDRRGSSSAPVVTQPMRGKSMVVPRVPKRPGEIVAIGSTDAGITRRISSGEEDMLRGKGAVALPSLLAGGGGTSGRDTPTKSEVAPPPLPAREKTPASSPKLSTINLPGTTEAGITVQTDPSGDGISGSAAHDGLPLIRSDSAPPAAVEPPRLPKHPVQGDDAATTRPDSRNRSVDDKEPHPSKEPFLSLRPETEETVPDDDSSDARPDDKEAEGTAGTSAEGILRDLQRRDERGRAGSVGESR